MQGRFLWHFPYLEGVQGVLDGVRRGPVGPPGPPELAAVRMDLRVLPVQVEMVNVGPDGLVQLFTLSLREINHVVVAAAERG